MVSISVLCVKVKVALTVNPSSGHRYDHSVEMKIAVGGLTTGGQSHINDATQDGNRPT